MTILIEINNGQPIPLMWYIFILLFFRILALENIAKILTTGPRLMMARLYRYLDSLSPQLKNTKQRILTWTSSGKTFWIRARLSQKMANFYSYVEDIHL